MHAKYKKCISCGRTTGLMRTLKVKLFTFCSKNKNQIKRNGVSVVLRSCANINLMQYIVGCHTQWKSWFALEKYSHWAQLYTSHEHFSYIRNQAKKNEKNSTEQYWLPMELDERNKFELENYLSEQRKVKINQSSKHESILYLNEIIKSKSQDSASRFKRSRS